MIFELAFFLSIYKLRQLNKNNLIENVDKNKNYVSYLIFYF